MGLWARAAGYRRRLWGFVRPSTRRGHLAYVDGARAVAAVYVVMHHCFQWLNTPPLPPGVVPSSHWRFIGWLAQGPFAVSAFIAISGYSLMLPVVRGDRRLLGGAWGFFVRRARRILPPYYFALGLSLVAIALLSGRNAGAAWLTNVPVTWPDLLAHVVLLHDVYNSAMYSINGPLWSIAIEWHIYFAFPLLVLLVRRFGVPLATGATSLLCFCGTLALIHAANAGDFTGITILGQSLTNVVLGDFALVLDYLGLFILGMLGAALAYAPQPAWVRVRAAAPWGVLALFGTVAYIAMFYQYGTSLKSWPGTLYADIATAVVVVIYLNWAAASERSPARAVLGWRPLATVGTFAYSIYLIHIPILGALYTFVMYPIVFPALYPNNAEAVCLFIAVALPTVLVLAYVFFLFCERPFLNPPGGVQRARAEAVAAQLAPAQAR